MTTTRDMSWPSGVQGLLPEGTVLKDEYRLTGYLGAGAFGSVYAAEQQTIRRRVAIKVLRVGQDATTRERFLREAQTAAQIDHEGVVTIFDYGVHEGDRPFIVMELLEGRDLREELDENGPLAPARALPLFIDCLDALGEGHKLGIVHKDLKPSNLFLIRPGTDRERIKIVDFGIARINVPEEGASEEAQGRLPSGAMTQSGHSIGTPQYIAPEYIRDQSASAAVDVYQMGLIIAEMLTGVTAVKGETFWSCAIKHLNGDLTFSDMLMNSPLGPVIKKATSLDPKERYVNAHALRAALKSLPDPNHPFDPVQTQPEPGPRVPTQPQPGQPPQYVQQGQPPQNAQQGQHPQYAQQGPMPTATGQLPPMAMNTVPPATRDKGQWALMGGVGATLLVGALVLFMGFGMATCAVCANASPSGQGTTDRGANKPTSTRNSKPSTSRGSRSKGDRGAKKVQGAWVIQSVRVDNPLPDFNEKLLIGVEVRINDKGIDYARDGAVYNSVTYTLVSQERDSALFEFKDGSRSTLTLLDAERLRITDHTPVGTVMILRREN